jgi:23S rRNA (guanine745-N1)-methyltransferase
LSFLANPNLRCPIDHSTFDLSGGSLRCEQGHSFDIAKQGYVNLLSAADKRSKDPGDSREMIRARREFLESGHYGPVAAHLVERLAPLLRDDSLLVDAGCGEGYYLQQLQEMFASPDILGFDISKWAMQAAARRFPGTWLVASNRNIPLVDNGADLVLSLFGFPAFEEFHRVLKEDAYLLLVNAGPRHLLELREVIYPEVRLGESTELLAAQAAGFTLVDSTTKEYITEPLGQLDIARLLTMTPHLFRASRQGKERARQLDDFAITVDVVFKLLIRSHRKINLSGK